MTPQQRQLYFNQQDTAETLYDFHPEVFAHLSKEELELLDRFYFIQREIDVDNITDYAAELSNSDPTIWSRAELALRKVCRLIRLDDRRIQELFSERPIDPQA